MNFLKALFTSNVDSITVDDAKDRINGKEAVFVLDVREVSEYQQGHIQGAKLIPLGNLKNRLDELPKDQEILCVCRSGARSHSAARQLNNAGYTALNLRGGMMGWQRAGQPVKKGK